MAEKDEGLLLTPEQRRDAFDRAEKRWREARRKEVYEFNTLWEYIVGETSKAQLAHATPIIYGRGYHDGFAEGREAGKVEAHIETEEALKEE